MEQIKETFRILWLAESPIFTDCEYLSVGILKSLLVPLSNYLTALLDELLYLMVIITHTT